MNAIDNLREEINGYDWMADHLQERLLEMVDAVELQFNEDLVSAEVAAEYIGVSKRHIFNLADYPHVDIWRYNGDMTRKMTNATTKVYFKMSELDKYIKESKCSDSK